MYEELQLKTMPKPPKPIKSILADGFVNKLFGIVSPSKLFMIYAKTNLSLEERLYLESEAKYFEDILKHKVYTRQASREDWDKLYKRYRIKKKQTVKDSPLMGRNLILIKLVLLRTLAALCTRFRRKSLHWRISLLSILTVSLLMTRSIILSIV